MLYLKRTLYLLVVLQFATLANSCEENSMDSYSPKQMITLEANQLSANEVEIIFQPILETLYHCPGVYSKELEGEIRVYFIRCSIKEKCETTHNAKETDDGKSFVKIENKGKPIVMVYPNGEQKLHLS